MAGNREYPTTPVNLEASLKDDDFRRQRITLSIISIAIILLVAGGGHIPGETFTVFGSSIELERPWVIVVALALLFLYSSLRFNHVSKGAQKELPGYLRTRAMQTRPWKSLYEPAIQSYAEQYSPKDAQIEGLMYSGIERRPSLWRREIVFKTLKVNGGGQFNLKGNGRPNFVLKTTAAKIAIIHLAGFWRLLTEEKIGTDLLVPLILSQSAFWLGVIRIAYLMADKMCGCL